jgi:pyrimidine deaminase RibD-like protein
MIPLGLWGPKEFAGMTDEELHDVKMGSQPGSNYWEWATAEQQERQRKGQAGIPKTAATTPKKESERWDFFISHASEDKEAIARPLADALRKDGWLVWYDDFSLRLGDSFRESIDRSLAASRFGIVILSPRFLGKHWPQQELNGLATREVNGEKVILPVWHEVGFEEMREYSPTLADRVAVSTHNGLEQVVERILHTASAASTGREPMVFEESVYWRRKNGEREGPYCPNCYDDKHKEIHLSPSATKGTYLCGVCRNSFVTEAYDPRRVGRLPFSGRRRKPDTTRPQPSSPAVSPEVLAAPVAETDDRKFKRLAIEEARKSTPDERVHPKVGVVVVKNGRILATAYRGEIPQCHAEYVALEKKLPEESLSGATVYTTLEPCTSRNHPKVPCAIRLAERKVARVVIGMLDPDVRIRGSGMWTLREAGIAIELFPDDLMAETEELNRDFIRDRAAARRDASVHPISNETLRDAGVVTDSALAAPQVIIHYSYSMDVEPQFRDESGQTDWDAQMSEPLVLQTLDERAACNVQIEPVSNHGHTAKFKPITSLTKDRPVELLPTVERDGKPLRGFGMHSFARIFLSLSLDNHEQRQAFSQQESSTVDIYVSYWDASCKNRFARRFEVHRTGTTLAIVPREIRSVPL